MSEGEKNQKKGLFGRFFRGKEKEPETERPLGDPLTDKDAAPSGGEQAPEASPLTRGEAEPTPPEPASPEPTADRGREPNPDGGSALDRLKGRDRTSPSDPSLPDPAVETDPDLGEAGEPGPALAPGDGARTAPDPAPVPGKPSDPPLPATAPPAETPAPEADVKAPGAAAEAADEPKKKRGLFGRLREGLSKTSNRLTGGISEIFTKRKLDDETLEELEDLLITADLGVPAAGRIVAALAKSKYDQEIPEAEVRQILAAEIARTLEPLEADLPARPDLGPHVILVTGVNGAGKTTTIGKLAQRYTDEGHKVLLAAGDTFRAAAVEQLAAWGERVGVPVVRKETGADAAGLAFDAIARAKEEGIGIVMIDTAGRLQNRKELMEELGKIVRVIKKLSPKAPHDTLLVLDATVGQNALSQAEAFLATADISGLIMTKLDGTARGGVLVALGDKFGLPIHFIGVGEGIEDLQRFDAGQFARALTGAEEIS